MNPGNDSFAGRISIPDTLVQKLSGLESRLPTENVLFKLWQIH